MKNSRFLTASVGIILTVAVLYMLFIKPNYYLFNGGQVYLHPVQNIDIQYDKNMLYTHNDYVYVCTNNGFMKKDMKGANIWSKAYTFNNPRLLTADGYMLVIDIMGKNAYLYNEEGLLHHYEVSWPILSATLNESGFVALISEKYNQHVIEYFNKEGETLVRRNTVFEADGYPITVGISDDAMKMATSYVQVDKNRLVSQVSFFGFSSQFEKKEEFLLGVNYYDNELVAEVLWLDSLHMAVISDANIYFYQVESKPVLLEAVSIATKIKKIEVTEKELIVQYGEARIEANDILEDGIEVFSFQGKSMLRKAFEEPVKLIKADGSAFFVVTSRNILKFEGSKRIWFAETYREVEDIATVEKNKYFILNPIGYEIYQIGDI